MTNRSFMLIIAAIILFASCKKKEDDVKTPTPSEPVCTLFHTVRTSSSCKDSTVIVYDTNRRISDIIVYTNCRNGMPGPNSIFKKSFLYQNNKVIIVDTSSSGQTDTLIVDASLVAATLRVSEHRVFNPLVGNLVSYYHYGSNNILSSSSLFYNGAFVDSTIYVFSGGDLIMQYTTNSMDTFKFSYYADKKVPVSGFLLQSNNSTKFGSAFIYKNEHLMESIVSPSGTPQSVMTYTYDSLGNVIKAVSTGVSNPVTTTYRYACAVE